MNNEEIKQFLKECVYYPCSAIDGAPVKFLGQRFRSFFYTDYSFKRENLDIRYLRHCFHGYECESVIDVPVETIFGPDWAAIKQDHERITENLTMPYDPENEYMVLAKFNRLPDFNNQHGAEAFSVLFARCEAITAYKAAFSLKGISPACLCYIRSGIGFGGNFSGFPCALADAIQQNKDGLPSYLLIDKMGSHQKFGDYFRLVESYQSMVSFPYVTEGYGPSKLTFSIRQDQESNVRP
jgi:hypothetical protein